MFIYMAKISKKLKTRILDILKSEYEDCDFFMAASNILTNQFKDISNTINDENPDFDKLRDEICEIGVYINNTEKRLLEVEDCYTKLVEALAEEKKDA
jgi:hypothetical protein